MSKIRILITLMFLSANLVLAQVPTWFDGPVKGSQPVIEGSPFLMDGWKLGLLRDTVSGKEYRTFINYDSHFDRITINYYGEIRFLDHTRFPEFTIDTGIDNTRKEGRYFVNADMLGLKEVDGYVEVIYDGEYRLLRKINTELITHVVPEYGTNRQIIRFITKENLFLLYPDGRIGKVKGGSNKIYALLGRQEPEARDIASKKDLNVKEDDDFIYLLNALETYK